MKHAIFALVLAVASLQTTAQCKAFTKKNCADELAPFASNGLYNGAILFEGEEASLVQTFYSNQTYRLLVCVQEIIAQGFYFEVLDYKNQLLYTSQGKNSNAWEFNVQSTQQLKIRAVVPDNNKGSDLKKNGCVSILIGFKQK